jgi:peptide/nickel transport system ATP-binding protein
MEAETPRAAPLLQAENLRKRYVRGGRFGARGSGVQALSGVDLTIAAGSTLALVGESGSGKSTLARCLALLESPDSGTVRYQGRDLLSLDRRQSRVLHTHIQLIFQDAAGALNPLFTVAEAIGEPLAIQGHPADDALRRQVSGLLEQVGLPERCAGQSPLALSGGQRQRVAIARALILRPRLIILDEALAGLDLSIQAQIANLLGELRVRESLTYLYISHDLSMVRCLADEIHVMLEGRIVERGAPREVFASPRHPYTRDLLASSPMLGRDQAVLPG